MFNNKYILFRNLAVLFIAGNMIYWVFPFSPVVWRVALVLLSLFVVFFKEGKRLVCENAVLIFAVFNIIHFFVSYLWQNPSTTQIGNILCAMLSLGLFVCLSEKGVMNDRLFFVIGVVLLVGAIMKYYHAERIALEDYYNEKEDITNNSSVVFLMLFPMLFLMKSNIQKWTSLLVCIFFLISGAKRGNIIAAIIPLILFIHFSFKDSRHSILKTIMVLGVIVGASYLTYYWAVSNDFLMYRIEQTTEGNSSGRDVIYAGAWHTWLDSNNFFHYLFGYGFDGTVHQSSTLYHYAHNDWLEILVDYGLLGIPFYLMIFLSLIKPIRRVQAYEMKMVLVSSVFIWLFKSVYSMGFTEEAMSVMMISMGTALGKYKTETKMQ